MRQVIHEPDTVSTSGLAREQDGRLWTIVFGRLVLLPRWAWYPLCRPRVLQHLLAAVIHVGNIGVPKSSGKRAAKGSPAVTLQFGESDYSGAHREVFGNQASPTFGAGRLRLWLMEVLESSIAFSLHGITNAARLELEDATYQFKLQYNGRRAASERWKCSRRLNLCKQKVGWGEELNGFKMPEK